MFYLSYLVS